MVTIRGRGELLLLEDIGNVTQHHHEHRAQVSLWEGASMPRGKKTSLSIHLTAEERQQLRVWQRSTTIPAGRARRGRIILLLADGVQLIQIADMVGTTRRIVYKWVRRFLQYGMEGLVDKPGRGRRPVPRQKKMSSGKKRGGRSHALE